MQRNLRNNKRRGNAMVEFSLASTVIFMVAMGAVDFGRLFFDSITIAGAAQAGVQRGTFSPLAPTDTAAIEAAASAGLADVEDATISSQQFCDCPAEPGLSVDCRTAVCAGYGLNRMYVRVRVSKQFETLAPWPFIPEDTRIDLSNWVRVR